MDRAFTPVNLNEMSVPSLNLTEEESFHLGRVRRKKVGDEIVLIDGYGNSAQAKITAVEKKSVSVQTGKVQSHPPPCPSITLFCSLTQASKFELILQKGTELQVGAFQPILTDHGESLTSKAKVEKKLVRWNQILREACKQSGNPYLPKLLPPLEFDEALETISPESKQLVAALKNNSKPIAQAMAELNDQKCEVGLWIGPEGDFSEREYRLLSSREFSFVSLGETVLRMETAAISAVAVIRLLQ